MEELKNTKGINIWSETQETLEQQALREIEAFAKETDIEEGEIAEERNEKPEQVAIVKPSLDINEFIKKQEELRKRQEHAKSLQVSEKSRLAAEKASKQQKRKRKQKSENEISDKKKVKVRAKQESDSDYVPSEDISDDEGLGDGTATPRKRRAGENLKIAKVKDDGSVTCYKARLEEYYKRLEEERSILNREDEEEEFHLLKGGLKIAQSIWNNLYG